MISILLLMRQYIATQEGENTGFTLMDQEALESKSWDELVKENRQKLNIKMN